MAGLIADELDPQDNEDLYDVTAAGPGPALRTVDAGKETVSGQLDTLLSKENPYITRARASAAERANARGLLNSSIAAGAGEAAAIEAALPIASSDASIFGTASRENQAAQNQFGAAQQAGAIESQLIGQRTEGTSRLQEEQSGQAESLARLRGEIDTGLQELRGNQAQTLAQIEADNRLLMQSSASASQFFTQTMESISAILNNPDMSVEQRQAAVDHQMAILNAGLAVIGGTGNIDLGGLVDFSEIENLPSGGPSQQEISDRVNSLVESTLQQYPDFVRDQLRDQFRSQIMAQIAADPSVFDRLFPPNG